MVVPLQPVWTRLVRDRRTKMTNEKEQRRKKIVRALIVVVAAITVAAGLAALVISQLPLPGP